MNFLNLLKRNKEVEPRTYEAVYGRLVEKELKKNGYPADKIQAIVNNYLAEPENDEYVIEFWQLQECRKQCKATIKNKLEVNN